MILENVADNSALISASANLARNLTATVDMDQVYDMIDSGAPSVEVGQVSDFVSAKIAQSMPDPLLNDVVLRVSDMTEYDADGMYDYVDNAIYIHLPLMRIDKRRALASVMAHELRHALDAYKSKGKAVDSSSKYANKAVGAHSNPDALYYSKSEINARLVQAQDIISKEFETLVQSGTPITRRRFNDTIKRAAEAVDLHDVPNESVQRRVKTRLVMFASLKAEELEKD